MTWRNLITTLDTGRTRTWRLPRFSALYIACGRGETGWRKVSLLSQTLENRNAARRWPSEMAGSRRPRVHTRLRNAATRTLRVSLRTLMRTMVGYLSTCVFCASERGHTSARDRKLVAEKTQGSAQTVRSPVNENRAQVSWNFVSRSNERFHKDFFQKKNITPP